jgi:hypothetical protein
MDQKYKGQERRESVRFVADIPMEYDFLNDTKSLILSSRKQGMVKNISSGGAQIEIEYLNDAWFEDLYNGFIKLGVAIKFPAVQETVKAIARLVWLTKVLEQDGSSRPKFAIGLEFVDITLGDEDRIKNYIISSYLGVGIV